MDQTILEVQDLRIHFELREGTVKALNGIDLVLKEGRTLGLVGETGAGKTTLAKGIMGLTAKPYGKIKSGKILYEGKNLLEMDKKQLRRIRGEHISMIFQDPMTSLNPVMTVGDQIAEAIRNHDKLSRVDAAKKAAEILDLDGIPSARGSEYPHQFSGGMKQRVGIAQALLNNPGILILDEPTAGLDPKERVRFRNLISSLAENRIVILSTHIVSDVEYIANEILIMKNGELIQHGSPEEILKPIEKCVWECDVSRKEAEELELNYVTANLKHNNGAERLRIISQEAPCRTAWNVDPTLEDLYLYYFAEVSEHE